MSLNRCGVARELRSNMILIKVGGGATINLDGIAKDLAVLNKSTLVVHGANALRDDLAKGLGHPTRRITSVSGIESVFTDENALKVLTMAYAGLVNKHFVQLCQQNGVNAIGLSGIDGALVCGRRNPGIRIVEDGKKKIVRDFSGKPTEINMALLQLLISEGYTVLLTVPILDEKGFAVNTENDSVVALLQSSLGVRKVIQLLEAPGLLERHDDPSSIIEHMNFSELRRKAAASKGRFRRKLMALSEMADTGCEEIIVADGRVDQPLHSALSGLGTMIR